MGPKPVGHCIIREDTSKGYSAKNCSWGPQYMNTSRNIPVIEYNGKKQTMAEWAKELGMKTRTLVGRINDRKWSIERAINTPVGHSR
jgi:hypothetical protein